MLKGLFIAQVPAFMPHVAKVPWSEITKSEIKGAPGWRSFMF